ncbi:MAG TPA: hypothetical protein VGM73_14830 [Candidatus Didemnitutus sp.]|jgi:hypothetical protein
MLLISSLLVLVFAAASLVIAHSLRHAPVGVEDADGFHREIR